MTVSTQVDSVSTLHLDCMGENLGCSQDSLQSCMDCLDYTLGLRENTMGMSVNMTVMLGCNWET